MMFCTCSLLISIGRSDLVHTVCTLHRKLRNHISIINNLLHLHSITYTDGPFKVNRHL